MGKRSVGLPEVIQEEYREVEDFEMKMDSKGACKIVMNRKRTMMRNLEKKLKMTIRMMMIAISDSKFEHLL